MAEAQSKHERMGTQTRMHANRPALKGPFLAMILAGIGAAAYVLGRDLGLV